VGADRQPRATPRIEAALRQRLERFDRADDEGVSGMEPRQQVDRGGVAVVFGKAPRVIDGRARAELFRDLALLIHGSVDASPAASDDNASRNEHRPDIRRGTVEGHEILMHHKTRALSLAEDAIG
jgi:hypothetical protein